MSRALHGRNRGSFGVVQPRLGVVTMQIAGECASCGVESRSRRREFTEQTWSVLLAWNEIDRDVVDRPICDSCYEELREILIDRADEVELAVTQPEVFAARAAQAAAEAKRAAAAPRPKAPVVAAAPKVPDAPKVAAAKAEAPSKPAMAAKKSKAAAVVAKSTPAAKSKRPATNDKKKVVAKKGKKVSKMAS